MSADASPALQPPVCTETGLPLLANGKVDTRRNRHGDHGDAVSAETRRKVVLAALAGNFVEWYEFAAYGVVAAFVAREFFSPDDPVAALLGVYAVFGLAFVARPIGGIIISRFGDTMGRKAVMSLCIVGMSLTTFGIGVLPSYAAIGIAAPLLLLLLRLLQGAAAGGEWSSAVSFVFEHSPATQRARWISYLAASTYPGLLGGVAFGSVLALTLGQDAFQSWGWRILFLVALPLGAVGLFIRRRVDESPAFLAVQKEKEKLQEKASPLREAFGQYRRTMLTLFMLTITYITGVYTNAALYVTFLIKNEYSPSEALNSNLVGLALMTGGVLVFGPLSDRFGRKPIIILGHILLAATIFPMFWLPTHFGTVWAAMLGCGMFSLAIAMIGAPVLTSLPELFPARVRATAGALPYNLATILAGFAPYMAIWLNSRFDTPLAYPFYVAALAMIGLAGTLWLYRDPSRYTRQEIEQLKGEHRVANEVSAPITH